MARYDYTDHRMQWRGLDIEARHTPIDMEVNGAPYSSFEVRFVAAPSPIGARLTIFERLDLVEACGPVAFIRQKLDARASSTGWRKDEPLQLALF